jgi:hypothetical protein
MKKRENGRGRAAQREGVCLLATLPYYIFIGTLPKSFADLIIFCDEKGGNAPPPERQALGRLPKERGA